MQSDGLSEWGAHVSDSICAAANGKLVRKMGVFYACTQVYNLAAELKMVGVNKLRLSFL